MNKIFLQKAILLFLAGAGLCASAAAQSGLPPKESFSTTVASFYTQHEDFKESFVSRLKTPAGYTVAVAASGLGKPRMMAMSYKDRARIYISII